jgi:hypothetical protein
MKSKTLRKKLVLTKNTIADLNNSTIEGINGGMQPPYTLCPIPATELTCWTCTGQICECPY